MLLFVSKLVPSMGTFAEYKNDREENERVFQASVRTVESLSLRAPSATRAQ